MKDINARYQAICPFCAEAWAENLDHESLSGYFYRDQVKDYFVPCPDCHERLANGAEEVSQTIDGIFDSSGLFRYTIS